MEDLYYRNKPFIISFVSSCSGCGKTTLIEKVIKKLVDKGYSVGALKHDAHKFQIDKKGKDSWKFGKAGAKNVIISSNEKLAIMKKLDDILEIDEILDYFNNEDIVIIEGFKQNPYPKIEVHRCNVSNELLYKSQKNNIQNFLAIATDEYLEGILNLNINNSKEVVDFIVEKYISRNENFSENNFNTNFFSVVEIEKVINLNAGEIKYSKEKLIVEHKLDVEVQGMNLNVKKTFYCTPQHLKELIVGFLVSDGYIKKNEEISMLKINKNNKVALVKINPQKKEYSSIANQLIFINPNYIFDAMHKNLSYSKLFDETGGVHCIGYMDKKGFIGAFEDIGRHNALDKLIGHIYINNLNPENLAIILSGRLSQEMVLKCSNAGINMIITKSAPTNLAYILCKEKDITLIGFVRNYRMNTYYQGSKMKVFNNEAIECFMNIDKMENLKDKRNKVLKETLNFKK